MLIDGELRHTGTGAMFDVIHPASEQVVGYVTDGVVGDVERAVSAARRAFEKTDWSVGLGSPSGGTKQSGLGRRNGEEGFKEYLESKTVGIPVAWCMSTRILNTRKEDYARQR